MEAQEIFLSLEDYTVVGDSHATTMAYSNFINLPVQNVYTMHSVYKKGLLEGGGLNNKHLIVCVGTNDLLLDLEEPLEAVVKDYFEYLPEVKKHLGLEKLIVITPPPVSKAIEDIRSDFDPETVIKRLTVIEEAASKGGNDFVLVLTSKSVSDAEGFLKDVYAHSDGVHLNEDGYRLLALEIIKSLKEIDNG
jgi:lysophospholipase L1-like esterase